MLLDELTKLKDILEPLVVNLNDKVKEFEAEVSATEEGGEGNPPAWVASESKWDKAKRASEEAFGEVRWPFVSWFYLNTLKGGTK